MHWTSTMTLLIIKYISLIFIFMDLSKGTVINKSWLNIFSDWFSQMLMTASPFQQFHPRHSRSSLPEVLYIRGAHKNFTKFTGKHLRWSPYTNKVVGLRLAALLKKRPRHWYFPMNFASFLRTYFLWSTSGSCSWHSYTITFERLQTGVKKFKPNTSLIRNWRRKTLWE